MEWTRNVEATGIIGGYHANQADYPPLCSVILFIISRMSSLSGLDTFICFKLSLLASLLLSTAIFWWWTRNGLLAVLFELSLVLSSTALGYTDIQVTPTFLLSLWALQKRRWLLFTLLYGVTCLIKWQPIIIAPVILLYILGIQRWRDWRSIDFKGIGLRIVLPALAGFLLVLFFFRRDVVSAFFTATREPLFSGNALNLNWLVTHSVRYFHPEWYGGLKDGLATWIITRDPRIVVLPKLMFCLSYLLSCWIYYRRPKSFPNLLLFALLAYLSYFMFNTGVHENHLYLAIPLSALLTTINSRYLPIFVTWAIAANANLYFFYGSSGRAVPFHRVVIIDIVLLLALMNLIFYFLLWKDTWRWEFGIPDERTKPERG
jgi:hypothetical protein